MEHRNQAHGKMESYKNNVKRNYLNKIKDLPETVKQFGGLVLIVLIIFFSFSVLNIMFGGGDELVRKMKLEEERIAEEKN